MTRQHMSPLGLGGGRDIDSPDQFVASRKGEQVLTATATRRGFIRAAVATSVLALLTPSAVAVETRDDTELAPVVTARIINETTGAVTELDIEPTTTTSTDGSTTGAVAGFNVEAPAHVLRPGASQTRGIITPLIEAGARNGSDVVARINLDYSTRASGEELRLNRVWGSWTPSNSQIVVSNREVHYSDQGPNGAHRAHKTPSSNSSNYNPGWGFVQKYPISQYSGAGAFTSASYSASGMARFTIEVQVQIP